MELLTSNAKRKKYKCSLQVQLGSGSRSREVTLLRWLKAAFQSDVMRPKTLAANKGTVEWKLHPNYSPPEKSSKGSSSRSSTSRIASYTGQGTFPLGPNAEAALQLAASAAAGPEAVYAWPQDAPGVRSGHLHVSDNLVKRRGKLLSGIQQGIIDLSPTHTPLHLVVPGASSARSSSSSSTLLQLGAAPSEPAAGPQVYDLQELQQRADDAGPGVVPAIVPDATQAFTLTLRNAADGRDYVVAHYEPDALAWGRDKKAAVLCEIYHSGSPMSRTSAPSNEKMVMAGMHVARDGDFGRYKGDRGERATGCSWCVCVCT